jgi:integrase/recombinase XerD
MQQLLSDLVGKAVDGGSSHSGRRTFATRLADRGVDLDYIKYLLGHKTKQQSLAYIESNTKRLRNILKGIYGDI